MQQQTKYIKWKSLQSTTYRDRYVLFTLKDGVIDCN